MYMSSNILAFETRLCLSHKKRLPTEDKSGAGIRIHDNNEGEESTVVRFEGEVSLGDLIWLKLLGKTWWPTVVCLWLFDLATSSFFRPFKD
ncbi:hypothetical protein E1A91_D01G173100v1 [Gossypium mustelinum]|uniref:PWWP domain-containing protein n=4 Tax=Gossypium TaxID=3633 RepID=A0A5J5SUM6_GOSBA|nr:hypothetical protein ES319_D01G166000v1 [Gossypium barbadense]TYG83584.1 hypothetical protein ES288_D01G179900v1 [Gossypium darwinii]TYH88350.1 hypothetical protein ES332_D01G181700v1 [Gossypium tomentosum]TYI97863.1 hypothetical protein E1A91_D01G173100v1 [Gossypium mustelinum]